MQRQNNRMIPPKVENNYLYRKQFLLEFLKQLVQENAEKEYLSVTVTEEDYQIAQKICEGIEQIPDGYCQNAQTIRIPVRDMEKNFTDVFMCAMDANSLEEHLVQHRNIIDVKFRHLSSGERFIWICMQHFTGVFRKWNIKRKEIPVFYSWTNRTAGFIRNGPEDLLRILQKN